MGDAAAILASIRLGNPFLTPEPSRGVSNSSASPDRGPGKERVLAGPDRGGGSEPAGQ